MAHRGNSSSKHEKVRQLFLESVEALASSPEQLVAAVNIGLQRVLEQLIHQACEEVGAHVDAFSAELESNAALKEGIQSRIAELFNPEALERARQISIRKELERHLHVLRYVLSGFEPPGWVWESMDDDERRRLRRFRAAGGEDDPELLARVQAAIGKIDRGTFGQCESCGKSILLERLQLLPWAERCTTCQGAIDSPPSPDSARPRVQVIKFFESGKRVDRA